MLILKALLYFLALVFIGGTVFGCVCTLAAWWVTERVRAGRGSGPAVTPDLAVAATDPLATPGAKGSIDPHAAEPLPPIRLECGCYYDGQQSYVCAIHARAWRLH